MSGELIVEKIKPANLEETLVLDGNAVINGTVSAQNIDAAVDITDMAEKIQQLQNRVTELENAAADIAGKVINVTYKESSIRQELPTQSIIELESFSVEKKSATSVLIIHGSISGHGNENGSMMQKWKYGIDSETLAQGIMFDENNHDKLYPTTAVIKGHMITGIQELSLIYYSSDASNNRPFDTYNPNKTDDVRLDQTKSVYVVYEIEQ